MSLKMFQILVSALLLTVAISGALGIPFLTEESANQFIRLKRQIPYSHSFWDPSSSQNTWGYSVAEQISESWTALRDTAQYYMDLGSYSFDPSIARYDGASQQSISQTHNACAYLMTTSGLTWTCYSSLGRTSDNRVGQTIKSYTSRDWQY